MRELRQRMITAMQMHGFSPRTQDSYIDALEGLAKYTRKSPDTLSPVELRQYIEYLVVERGLSPSSVHLIYNGLRFLYLQVLQWPGSGPEMTLPKRA